MAQSSKRQQLPQTSIDTANNLLPATIANLPQGLGQHIIDGNFRLIFEYYDHRQCDLKKLNKQNMKKVIDTFSKITKHDNTNIKQLCRPNPVKRSASGEYGKLFNNLPIDFDYLLEVQYTKTGRILIHPLDTMCLVVAVWGEHRK